MPMALLQHLHLCGSTPVLNFRQCCPQMNDWDERQCTANGHSAPQSPASIRASPAVRCLRREFREATPPLLAAKIAVLFAAGADKWALQRTVAHERHVNLVSEVSLQKS